MECNVARLCGGGGGGGGGGSHSHIQNQNWGSQQLQNPTYPIIPQLIYHFVSNVWA